MPALPPVPDLPQAIPCHPLETDRRAHDAASKAFHRRLVLGRDLSPEAIADLEDEAAELNAQAEAATAKVKEMLETADKTQGEADAEFEASTEGE